MAGADRGLPRISIPFVFGDIQAIYDRHAARQLAPRFHLDVMIAPIGSDSRIERNAHRNRIGQAKSIFASLRFVSLARMAIALNSEVREFTFQGLNIFDIVGIQYRSTATKMPPDQFHWQPAAHDDACRLGIDPDVVLRGRSHVALATGSASHNNTPANLANDARILRDSESDIRQRS